MSLWNVCSLSHRVCSLLYVSFNLPQVHFTSIGRIATLFPRKYSIVPPISVMPVFVTIDIASLVIQGVGAASAGTAETEDVCLTTNSRKLTKAL